jgi:MYXO-CTERM domain-containing protein
LTGIGQDVDTLITDEGGGVGEYNVSSSFQEAAASITSFPGALGSLPISPSAPASGPDPGLASGPDPGLTLTAAPNINFGFAFLPPLFNLAPPPGSTDYSDTILSGVTNNFQYGLDTLYVGFAGETDLTLGPTPVLTGVAPDPFIKGFDYYTYSYADTTLALTTSIGELDPSGPFPGTLTFKGDLQLVVAAAPDSSPGLAGVLALLGVCAGGVWQKRAKAA